MRSDKSRLQKNGNTSFRSCSTGFDFSSASNSVPLLFGSLLNQICVNSEASFPPYTWEQAFEAIVVNNVFRNPLVFVYG